MQKLNKRLVKLLILSAALFVFSIFFSNKGRNAPKSTESVLFNPKYLNETDSVIITVKKESGDEVLTIKKEGDFWLLKKQDEKGNELCTFADIKLVSSFFERLCEFRKLYKVSDKEKDFSALATDENNALSISFTNRSGKDFPSLYFGHQNQITGRIFLRSGESKTTYESQNNLSQFLTTDLNYWAEGEILSGINNPLTITLSQGESSKAIDEKTEGFEAKKRSLLSLRHGKIISEKALEEILDKGKMFADSFFKAQDGSGRIAVLTFFKAEEGGESIYYTRKVTPSPAESSENTFVLYSENCAYEISEWTYHKIISIFN